MFDSLLYIFIFLNCSIFSYENEEKFREINVPAEYIEACETGEGECLPIIIQRKTTNEKIKLVMPMGGTFTSIYLYDAPYNLDEKANPLLEGTYYFQDKERPVFNLTEIKDGRYVVHMLACGLGGFFSIELKTETKK